MRVSYLAERHQNEKLPNCDSKWMQLHVGVPKVPSSGLFCLSFFRQSYARNCYWDLFYNTICRWYLDFLVTQGCKIIVEKLNTKVENLIVFSTDLNISTDKSEFYVFCKSRNIIDIRLSVKCQKKLFLASFKFLGVLDWSLRYKDEVEKFLRKMVSGIKTANAIRAFFPIKTRLLLLNALCF